MSVRRSDYVLIGVNLDTSIVKHDDDFYENNEDKYFRSKTHQIGKIAYIYDGMSGEYFLVGIPLAFDHEGYEGLPLLEVDTESKEMGLYKDMVKEHIKQNFNLDCEPKLIVVSHFS